METCSDDCPHASDPDYCPCEQVDEIVLGAEELLALLERQRATVH